jgi:hypothetical protein
MEERKIYAKHNRIQFENNYGDIFINKLSDCTVEVGDEGDAYVIHFKDKHTYVFNDDFSNYSEEDIQRLLEHDWVNLYQDDNGFVGINIDCPKMEEELERGIAQIKQGNIKTRAFNDLITKFREYEELWAKDDFGVQGYFSTLYHITYGLSPTILVYIDNDKYIALKEAFSVVGTNIFFGNDIRVLIQGINDNKDFVHQWFYFTLESSEEKKKLKEAYTDTRLKSVRFQKVGNKWKTNVEYC